MGAWLMAGAGLAKGLGAFIGSRTLSGGIKRAGTELYQSRQREAANAAGVPETINPGLAEAYQNAATGYSGVANRSADDLGSLARQGAAGVNTAATGANEYLNPYVQGGQQAFRTLSDLAAAPEERFDFQFSQDDPSYQFRMNEGQKAIERSAASRGIGQTGGTLKALTNYGQQAASQEYQSAYNRALGTFNANQGARQQRVGTLSGLAGIGSNAATASGQNLYNAATYGGNLGMQAGQTGGNWRNAAALQEGNYGIDSQKDQANIAMKYGDLARNLRLSGDEATAQSILANAGVGADMWQGLGGAAGSAMGEWGNAKGGWGGGWNWGGATPGSYPGLPTTGASGGYNYPIRPRF
jgi:hypothetical protein